MAKTDRFEAVGVFKVDGTPLCRAFALTIEGDRVVDSRELTRAEDVASIAIGYAQRVLWVQYRKNRIGKKSSVQDEGAAV